MFVGFMGGGKICNYWVFVGVMFLFFNEGFEKYDWVGVCWWWGILVYKLKLCFVGVDVKLFKL